MPAVDTPPGSQLIVAHTERVMNSYLLLESDLDNLTTLSGTASFFASLGTFLLALWLDIFKDTVLATAVPDPAQEAIAMVNPILGIGFVASYVAAVIFWIKRGTVLSRIRNESKSIKGAASES